MTIYLPDDLAAEVKDKLGTTNISAVCQNALRDELDRVKARAEISDEGFERVEVYDLQEDTNFAFQGREIGEDPEKEVTAYLTAGERIAIYDGRQQRLRIFQDFSDLDRRAYSPRLMSRIASALGEKYVYELDI